LRVHSGHIDDRTTSVHDCTSMVLPISAMMTRPLDLSLLHTSDIDIPLYTFATGITHGTVISSAKWLAANSKIRRPWPFAGACQIALIRWY
jgi:hypothetical protein